MITCVWPLGPRVPDSNNGTLFSTHLWSTYLLAATLSKAFATIVNDSKKLLEKIFLVDYETLSKSGDMWFLR